MLIILNYNYDLIFPLYQAVCRGFIAREALKRYMRHRYNKRLCAFSHYFYFVDTFNKDIEVETSWYKPRLAFPDDIQEFREIDPDDYLVGKKYSNMGFSEGPYCRRVGLKKSEIKRSEHIAFLKPDEWYVIILYAHSLI